MFVIECWKCGSISELKNRPRKNRICKNCVKRAVAISIAQYERQKTEKREKNVLSLKY